MKIRFPHIVLILSVTAFIIIYLLSLGEWVTATNELYFRYFMLGTFIVGITLIIAAKIKEINSFSTDMSKGDMLLVVSLSLLLIATIFRSNIATYFTGIFIGTTLFYFILNKKVYSLNRAYVFLFLYALQMILGTIGTPKGFHFPDKTLSFLLLPLAYCCFDWTQKKHIHVAHLFFKGMIVYLAVCVIYWWFNFQHIDVAFFDWVTNKKYFDGNAMIGWSEQIRLSKGTFFPAYFFVTSWAYYYHPSYISLVLFFGLIVGFYLYYKKDILPTVTKTELFLYSLLCITVIILMESRIGVVGFMFILGVTGLYYSKLKTSHFKIITLFYFALACFALVFFNDSLNNFVHDNVRETDYTLAAHYIKEHIWWGSGFEEQTAALKSQEQIMKDTLPIIGNAKFYTHNQFLGNMVQFGVWGLLVLLVMLLVFANHGIKSRNYLLQLFILIMILFMMIEEPLYGQKGVTIFTVFLTFFVAIGDSRKPRKAIDLSKK